jgi:hypothetical protein
VLGKARILLKPIRLGWPSRRPTVSERRASLLRTVSRSGVPATRLGPVDQGSGFSSQRDPGEWLDGACRGDVLFPVLADQ